jgi:hypothetical protein
MMTASKADRRMRDLEEIFGVIDVWPKATIESYAALVQ